MTDQITAIASAKSPSELVELLDKHLSNSYNTREDVLKAIVQVRIIFTSAKFLTFNYLFNIN